MAIVLKDRVKETTTTTGTSNFVLGGSSSGYQAFSVIGANNFTYYCAFDQSTGDWEVGYGQYTTTAGGTLVRTTILSNSAATTSKISFGAGPKDVFITYPAEKAIYEEDTGNVLIDGGPITVVGTGVTGYTTFSAALGELYANVPSFAQFYAQNYNDDAEASTDFVVYNDLGDGVNNFADMGINSSLYSSLTYPIFTGGSAYFFNDGGELFIGSATDDVVLFAGGVDTTDEAVRISASTKDVTTVADVNVGGALDVTGAAVFGSTVLLDADPTLALQAATKAYVDGQVAQGFTVHTPVKAVANTYTGAGATYNNAAGTITNNTNAAFGVVDGVTINVGDRVLFRALTNAYENGVYTLTVAGSGATPWVVTRATDFDTVGPGEIANNAYFFVSQGTTYKGYAYVLSQLASPIVLGTTSLPFTEFAASTVYAGGTNITVSGQTIDLSGTVAATNGGTGTNTVATGDLLYGSAADTWSKLSVGAGYKSLVMNGAGTLPEWNAVALNQSGAVSGTLPATNGGTGQNAYALGDILYADATNSVARLAGNTTTTKKFLGQTGTGSASAAPSWQQPAASDITGLAASATTNTTNATNITSGTLPSGRLSGNYPSLTGVGTIANGVWNADTIQAIYGGTGTNNYVVGDLLYANTTTTLAKLADVAVGNALISGGVGSAPSWGKIGLATHVSGTLPIANGGTGSTATTYCSLTTNVTGALPIANGGTNATDAATALTNLGAQATLVSGTNIKTINSTSILGSGDLTVSATAGGSNTQVQYNSGGLFAGSANLTFDGTNLTCGGAVTGNSDETLKTNWRDLPADFVEQLAKVKHGTYDRVDMELTQDGVSAQSLQPLLPNSVLKGEDGKLSVAYGNAALVAAIALAERVVQLEAIVAKLTKGTDQ